MRSSRYAKPALVLPLFAISFLLKINIFENSIFSSLVADLSSPYYDEQVYGKFITRVVDDAFT